MTPPEAQKFRMQLVDQGDFVTFTVRKSDVPVIKAVIGMLTDIYLADAQGIEARSAETQSGSVVDESAVPEGNAPK